MKRAEKRLCALALFALALGGCACGNPRNTPLLTALDGAVRPESRWAEFALGPVFLPAGAACGALDVFVVHPLHAVLLSAEDVRTLLWAKAPGSFVQESLLFVPKVAATPVVFAFCWFAQSAFDLRKPEEKTEARSNP